MGQQQILLIVLGIVIVGIAIVSGISAYSENNVKQNFDSLMAHSISTASNLQVWKQKPEVFLGSPDGTKNVATDFSAYNDGNTTCSSGQVGEIAVSAGDASTGAVVMAFNSSLLNLVVVEVTGTTEQDLEVSTWLRGGANETGNPGVTNRIEKIGSLCGMDKRLASLL